VSRLLPRLLGRTRTTPRLCIPLAVSFLAAAIALAMALVGAAAVGFSSAEGNRADGAAPRAHSSATLGTLACTDRLDRLVLVRGDGRKRRTLKVKGENPIFSPDGRLIAYRAVQRGLARNISPKLRVSDRSGRNVRTVVSLPRSAGVPPTRFEPLSWSSDSKRLAYVRTVVVPRPDKDPDDPDDPDGGDEPAIAARLFTANAMGGERMVPLHRAEVPPSDEQLQLWSLAEFTTFSPDGKTLAIGGALSLDLTSGRFTNGIWLVDASNGAARLLLELPNRVAVSEVLGLTWSPDGNRLAVYNGAVLGPSGFFVVDVHTAKATRGDALIGASWMRWSPDSRHIAVDGTSGAGRLATYDSRVADADMSRVIDPSRRTPKRFEERQQLWSPDGRRIAFNRTYRGSGLRYGTKKAYNAASARSGVYIVPARGGKPRRLIGSSPASDAQWESGIATDHPNEITCTDWSGR
jgi:Tol biopolymer transport system component